MGLLDELMGSGERQQDFRDFMDPTTNQGAPYEGTSDDDAVNRYGQVAVEVDPDTYRESARDAFANRRPRSASSTPSNSARSPTSRESVTVGTGSPPTPTPSPRSPDRHGDADLDHGDADLDGPCSRQHPVHDGGHPGGLTVALPHRDRRRRTL